MSRGIVAAVRSTLRSAFTERPSLSGRALAGLGALAVLYAGLCKALLFYQLEYVHTDFFSFIEMSRSLQQSGELLRDNVYGHHAAIHNYYLMFAFSPLILAFGAYGLILGLVALHLLAVLRVACATSLDTAGRVTVLGAYLGPIAYAVFDDAVVGFNPELCYPPLAVLLALDLREGRSRRALLVAALACLVKEDGVILCASILVAFFGLRLFELRQASPAERRPLLAAAIRSLGAAALVFVAGLALLWVMGRAVPPTQTNAELRVIDALRNVGHAVAGRGLLRQNLQGGLVGYLVVGFLTLLPLGKRLARGAALLLVSSPALIGILLVSSGIYRFRYMLWPHRVAALLALAVACVVFVARERSAERSPLLKAAALVALSWTLQLVALHRAEGYAPWGRLDAYALSKGEGTRAKERSPEELRFLRCLGARLPRGLPVSAFGDLHPPFHLQSVVFEARAEFAKSPPRLRVVPASEPPHDAAACHDPGVGALVVECECSLLPLVTSCR